MLIVFTALMAMCNGALGLLGEKLLGTPLSLEQVPRKVFYPLAWVMGVPGQDVEKVASLLGQKTVLNEFVAYARMGETLKADPTWLTERGRTHRFVRPVRFANFASIGIQIGGYSGLAPERRVDLSRVALRAMIGGPPDTCMVACVAGVLA